MKPLGLTCGLRIIHPTPAEDKAWEAVEAAIAAGWEPRRFVNECRAAWAHLKQEEAKTHDAQFSREEP